MIDPSGTQLLLPKPPADVAHLWMRVAWLASSGGSAISASSGVVALRRTPPPERVLAVAGALGPQRSAIAELLVQAAGNGICLRGATCFLWPDLGSVEDFKLLLDTGIKEVCIPSLVAPQRLSENFHACRWAASSLGVSIETLDMDNLFRPLRDALRDG